MQLIQRMAVVVVLAASAVAAQAYTYAPQTGTGKYGISTEVSATWLGDGQWEYAYDIFAQGGENLWYDYLYMQFEFGDGGSSADHILNLYDPGAGPQLREFWTVNGLTGNNGGNWFWGGVETGVQASYGDLATNTWIVDPSDGLAAGNRWFVDHTYAAAAGIANPFHDPLDYGRWAGNSYYTGQGDCAFGLIGGGTDDTDGDGLTDDINYDMTWFLGGHVYGATTPQLMATIRVVSDLGPYGDMRFKYYGAGSQFTSFVMAPAVAPDGLGDFDGDGDVDADDIDLLCANIGGDPATYDLDGDGDVDEDDFIVLIETLTEWDNDVTSGVGTFRGDFNPDGVVDLTDLQILKQSFTLSGIGYAAGNANCDSLVDLTDLQIMTQAFGSVAAAAVPEPAFATLLVLGGVGLLRRRNRR